MVGVPPQPVQKESDPRLRRALAIEIAVVLGIAVVPDFVNAMLVLVMPHPGHSIWGSIGLLDRSLRITLAVLFVMWRSGRTWKEFGLAPVRWIRDPLLGLAIWLLTFAAVNVAMYGGGGGNPFGFHAFPAQMTPSVQTDGWAVLVAIAVANGFTEELVLRGHLIPAFERLWGGTAGPILVTTALATAYHVYGGAWFIIDAAIFNLLTGMFFAATRRLWPVVFAHMLSDFLPYVLYGS